MPSKDNASTGTLLQKYLHVCSKAIRWTREDILIADLLGDRVLRVAVYEDGDGFDSFDCHTVCWDQGFVVVEEGVEREPVPDSRISSSFMAKVVAAPEDYESPTLLDFRWLKSDVW